MDSLPQSPASAPAPAPVPGAGSAGTAPSANGEHLRTAHDAIVAKHTGGAANANAGKFSTGRVPWNKGQRGVVAPAAAPASGPASDAGAPPALPPAAPAPVLVDKETVKRLVELGLNALDRTLQTNMAAGWFSISGDRDLALQQAQFYALKIEQQQAIALCAGLVAEKYAGYLGYLPEAALAVTVGTYCVNWQIGFNKLKQAALLKQQAAKTDEEKK